MTAHSKAAVAAGDKLAELCGRKIATSDDYVNGMDVVDAYLEIMRAQILEDARQARAAGMPACASGMEMAARRMGGETK